jgi:uncharacterized membrane protein
MLNGSRTLLPLFTVVLIMIVMASITSVAFGKTYIKIHFRNVPLAETALIELTTPDDRLYTWRTVVLPVIDFSGTIQRTLAEGTPLNACVTNVNTGAGPNCGSASVRYGYADFYILMPR